MKSLIYFVAHFEVRDPHGHIDKAQAYVPSNWSVERLSQGFWLNEDFDISYEGVYWVAPARLIGVEKKKASGAAAVSLAKKLGLWIPTNPDNR